jgi:hypothetical protein
MPLFLVTCVCDEGVGKTSFRVVEAPSRIAVAESMLYNSDLWIDYLQRSHLRDKLRDRQWRPIEWLREIDSSSVDGDSRFQLAIHEIAKIEKYE